MRCMPDSMRSAVVPAPSKIVSRSWRGRPVHAHTVCFIVSLRVVSGSPSAKPGSSVAAGVSQANAPSSTSRAINNVVSGLLIEATRNSVSAVTGARLPSWRTPKPSASTSSPPCTTATEMPGICSCFWASMMNARKAASLVASSAWAGLPTKDSCTRPGIIKDLSAICACGKRRPQPAFVPLNSDTYQVSPLRRAVAQMLRCSAVVVS